VTTLYVVLGAIALLLAATWLHLWFWTRRLEPRLRYALVETLATEDGSAIELRRIGPSDVADVDRAPASGETLLGHETPLPPVLLVHGIGIDHRNVDMFDGRSLARALAGRGRDVWLLTLRSGRVLGLRAQSQVTFERMARHDVPLAFREVLRRTGATELDYLGFSMGGMLLYAGLAIGTLTPRELRRVAILGSPGRVLSYWRVVSAAARLWPDFLMPVGVLSLPSRLVAFIAGHLPATPIHTTIIQPSQLSARDVGAALTTIRDIPRPLLGDFARFMRSGKLEVGGIDVLAALATLRIPAVFVAGAGDRIASPEAVRAGFEAWGAAHPDAPKWFHNVGRAGGAKADYGHGDLAFGIHAPVDVYPLLLAHLEKREP
jgi:polyhydroxyalkanoate synthase subunit PhaC